MEEIGITNDIKLLLSNDDHFDKSVIYRCSDVWYKIPEKIGNPERIILSEVTGLIVYQNKDIGYICATSEKRYPKGLFLDMAIIKEFRNKGIGKSVISKFTSNYNDDRYLIGETTKDNFSANINGLRLGTIIPIHNDFNYYLFSKNKLNSFNLNEFEHAMSEQEESYRSVIQKVKTM